MDEMDLGAFWEEFEAEVRENLRQLEEGLLNLEEEDERDARVHDLMRLAHTIKGAARLMSQESIAALAAELEHALRRLREGETEVTREYISHCLRLVDALYETLNAASSKNATRQTTDADTSPGHSPEGTKHNHLIPPSPSDTTISPVSSLPRSYISTKQLDELTALSTILHIQHMGLQTLSNDLKTLITTAINNGEQERTESQQLASSLQRIYVRLQRLVEEIGTTLYTLESNVLQMRLVPFSILTPVLRRIVRDAAEGLNKRVKLIIEGERTQIDKLLVGPLQDALIHILRNAVDHGIEPADERRAIGKPPVGQIHIQAVPRGNSISIIVKDDGRGVNIEKVKRQAVERGLLLPGEAETLSEHETLKLLFRPGFTTRSKVSAFSGQGVGLDAVASLVQRLGGTVDIESVPDQGTTVTLNIPMNLALVDVLLVNVGPYSLAIPIARVKAVLAAKHVPLLGNGTQAMIQWKDTLIPAFSLLDLFPPLESTAKGQHILILQSGRHRVAALGGTVWQHVTLALRPLPALLAPSPFIYGVSILGDGTVVFVITVESLARAYQSHAILETSSGSIKSVPSHLRILVAEDGITTREMLQSALTAAGFRVLLAKDGEEALQILSREGYVDAIITDIHMPKVDGITLIRRIRSDPAWNKIPIIVLSIHDNPEDIRLGMEAGATAYLTKQNFTEGTLLEVLERVL